MSFAQPCPGRCAACCTQVGAGRRGSMQQAAPALRSCRGWGSCAALAEGASRGWAVQPAQSHSMLLANPPSPLRISPPGGQACTSPTPATAAWRCTTSARAPACPCSPLPALRCPTWLPRPLTPPRPARHLPPRPPPGAAQPAHALRLRALPRQHHASHDGAFWRAVGGDPRGHTRGHPYYLHPHRLGHYHWRAPRHLCGGPAWRGVSARRTCAPPAARCHGCLALQVDRERRPSHVHRSHAASPACLHCTQYV